MAGNAKESEQENTGVGGTKRTSRLCGFEVLDWTGQAMSCHRPLNTYAGLD